MKQFLRTTRSGALLTLLLVSVAGFAQPTSTLFPEWSFEVDRLDWAIEVMVTPPEVVGYLDAIAREKLAADCTAFETIRMRYVGDAELFGPPLADIDLLAILEGQYGGTVFLDANLTSTYGHSTNGRIVFSWDAPWGLWPYEGIFVMFHACQTSAI